MGPEFIIKTLGLQALEPEGGHFAQTFKSSERSTSAAGDRALMTAIYYLISWKSFSRFHRLQSTEIYHFYAGQPAELSLIYPDGRLEVTILGHDIAGGQQVQKVVPKLTWQAVKMHPQAKKDDWSLMGTTVAPGFEFDDFEMGTKTQLAKLFPQHRSTIEALCAD